MTDTPARTNGQSATTAQTTALGIGADILDRVQDILKGGKIRSVSIKIGNKTVKQIPTEAAAVTAVILAVAAVVISQLHIELNKD